MYEIDWDTAARVHVTRREAEILRLIANGESPKEIAERTHRSYPTVRTHLMSLRRKLDATSPYQLLMRATEAGVLVAVERFL
jgi:DNA-binding CsgD family transcriptional regulator